MKTFTKRISFTVEVRLIEDVPGDYLPRLNETVETLAECGVALLSEDWLRLNRSFPDLSLPMTTWRITRERTMLEEQQDYRNGYEAGIIGATRDTKNLPGMKPEDAKNHYALGYACGWIDTKGGNNA